MGVGTSSGLFTGGGVHVPKGTQQSESVLCVLDVFTCSWFDYLMSSVDCSELYVVGLK